MSSLIYDDVIMRTIVDLPDDQLGALADLCKAQKISRAEAVRRALSDMLAREHRAGKETAFGTWKKRNGRKLVERLRHEWDRR
jgi:metal-responsive CopG/Arc/MetJ family transcriptional regulator